MAATYGWTVARVRDELTDEQLVLVYQRQAQERLNRAARVAFDNAVESVRMGTIFAHSSKAYRRWTQRKPAATRPKPLDDAGLERAILMMAQQFPGNIEFGTLPASS